MPQVAALGRLESDRHTETRLSRERIEPIGIKGAGPPRIVMALPRPPLAKEER